MRRRRKDSGFAMLLIFLMAAIVAITLYMSSIRLAFDTQRQKEQLLMERGGQYRRAIQLFVKANKRWPASIDNLENYNAKRYLRHRYKDPMTGKDEWRLIHIANGILQDSVLNKKPSDQQQTANVNNYIGEVAGLGQTLPGQGAGAGVNLANRRRASDTAGAPGGGLGPDGQPLPQSPSGLPGIPPGAPGMPPPNGQPFPGQPGGAPLPPGVPGIPGFPPQPGAPVNSQTGGVSPSPYPTAPGSQGTPPNFPQPGTAINGQGQNAAGQMITTLLTTPRPGGLAGLNAGGNNTLGAGIAGVASNADAEGIMTLNDRTNYGEWEFLYDPSKDKPPPNPNLGTVGTPASQLGSPAQSASPGPQPGIGINGMGGPGVGRSQGNMPGGIGGPGNQIGQNGPGGQAGQGALGGNFGVGGGVDIRPGRK